VIPFGIICLDIFSCHRHFAPEREHQMAVKKESRSSKADRLRQALMGAETVASSRPTPRSTVVPEKVRPVTGRTIKFPNSAGALRQHVAEARRNAAPRASIELNLSAPVQAGHVPNDERRDKSRFLPSDLATMPRDIDLPETLQVRLAPLPSLQALGQIVRDVREQRRMTQAQLADIAGTGRRFISELEGGKPSLEFGRVMRVCAALGIRLLAAGGPDG
jgi:y4mF family transcriptional regulator